MPRHHDHYDDISDYAPSRRRDRVVETEEIDIRERRSGREREPEFLREDYGRSSAGPLVLREEEVIEERVKPKRKHRPREVVEEEEVRVSRSSGGRGGSREEVLYRKERDRERDRPGEREEIREEIIYQPREREYPYAKETEEFIYRARERSPPIIAREKEEYVFAPRRRAVSLDREEVTIRERKVEREVEKPRERDRGYEKEEIIIRRDEREREKPRERDYKQEELIIRRDDRDATSTRGGYERDEIIMRERSRERVRPRDDYESESITIRREERDRAQSRDYRDQELIIRRDERERPRERDYKEAEITIRRDERERPRQRDFKEEEVIIRRDERERTRPQERDRGFQEEDIIIRRNERDGGRRDRDTKQDEIIIRRQERSPSPEFILPPPEPETIRAPPIHQEIITHHRHIDHGFEVRQPVPAPPRRSPSPKSTYDEIEIHRRGEHNGHRYDDDIIIDTRRKPSTPAPAPPPPILRRRSISAGPAPAPRSRYDPIADEADYYARRTAERAYMGEAYNGATRDWAIVDVPPGTNRVQMDGVGGASQEVTWQRYNGVRRSNFITDDERYAPAPVNEERGLVAEERGLDKGRRFVGQRDKKESMWTEITKDLVVREAIEGCGYDFEETEWFYYVMQYLRYEDVLRLVEISESLRRERRDRIRQIEWEQAHPPERAPPRKLLAAQPWDEERVFEREIVYERPPPVPRPLTPVRREVREKTYVLR